MDYKKKKKVTGLYVEVCGRVCVFVCGLSRVLAHPQVLKTEQASRVQGHQDVASLHDVEPEGPGADDDPLGLRSQRQHHPVLILGQERQTGTGGKLQLGDKYSELVAINFRLSD